MIPAVRRLPKIPLWTALAGLVVTSAALRLWGAWGIPSPWIAPDEMVYGVLGQSLYRTGELAILGGPTPFYSFVYPAIAGLPLALGDLELGYALLRPLQGVVMSLAAVPVYLWSRLLMKPAWALLASALTLAVPGLAYSGLVMTEVAFYPVMALAAWTIARALVRPTAAAQALVVGAFSLACATRLQAVVLIPALVTAIGLKALFDRNAKILRSFGPGLAALFAIGLAWAGWQLRGGGPWTQLLAAYQEAGQTPYDASEAARFVLYHAGDALFFTGVFPLCALLVLLVDAVRGREPDEHVRAFLAVSSALALWLVVEVGIFASRQVGRLAERDLLAVAPLLFIGFALWLGRGAERPRLRTSLIVLAAAVPVLVWPLEKLISQEALPDAFSLVTLYWVKFNHPELLELVVYGGVAVSLALFALCPNRLALVLPALVAAALAGASVAASRHVAQQASLQQRQLIGPERDWIDEAVPTRAAYLYNGDFYWNAVWTHLFWNRDLRSVYFLPGAPVPGPLPQRRVDAYPDGRLMRVTGKPIPETYVVASTVYELVGRPVARIRQVGLEQAGLVLWQADAPARLTSARSGVNATGDIGGHGSLTVYACGPGEFRVTLIAKEYQLLAELRRDGRTLRRLTLFPHQVWRGSLPSRPKVPGRAGTCIFDVLASNVLGSTQFEFKPRRARAAGARPAS
ncbi:MAG: glycosyltransferase family 39 protein [Actinobacteria bacterium]|nr:glycosyltransferase family 39 protein [Actinomycetota bacterium]